MPKDQDDDVPQSPVIIKTSHSKRLRRPILLGLVPLLSVVVAVGFWLQGARFVTTENAYVKTNIAKLAAEVSGRAITVHARAHMHVNEGDVLVGCHVCGQVQAVAGDEPEETLHHCVSCAAAVHQRKPNHVARTWALMIAGFGLAGATLRRRRLRAA